MVEQRNLIIMGVVFWSLFLFVLIFLVLNANKPSTNLNNHNEFSSGNLEKVSTQNSNSASEEEIDDSSIDNPPLIETYSCQEIWNCSGWGQCLDNNKSRQCSDLSNCRTEIEKPIEIISCQSISGCESGNFCNLSCVGGDSDCSCSAQDGKFCNSSETCIGQTILSSDIRPCCFSECLVNQEENIEDVCIKNCLCSLVICIGTTCEDGCDGFCNGIQQPNCGTRKCGPVPNNCGENCGVCDSGTSCNNGTCVQNPPEPECVQDSDCAEGEKCDFGNCVEDWLGCNSDLNCQVGFKCLNFKCTQIIPFLTTNWSQYNEYARFAPDNPDSSWNWRLGCWSTAFAQILYYHKLIPHGSVSYTPKTGTLNINLNNYAFDFSKFVDNIKALGIPDESKIQVTKYSYFTSVVVQKDFSTSSYVLGNSGIRDQLEEHYNVDVEYYIFENIYNNKQQIENIIKTEIDAHRPFMMHMSKLDGSTGHAIVVDAYQIRGNDLYVHINMGSAGSGNTWYKFFAPISSFDGNKRRIFTVRKL